MLAVNYTTLRENMKTYMDKVSDDYETIRKKIAEYSFLPLKGRIQTKEVGCFVPASFLLFILFHLNKFLPPAPLSSHWHFLKQL